MKKYYNKELYSNFVYYIDQIYSSITDLIKSHPEIPDHFTLNSSTVNFNEINSQKFIKEVSLEYEPETIIDAFIYYIKSNCNSENQIKLLTGTSNLIYESLRVIKTIMINILSDTRRRYLMIAEIVKLLDNDEYNDEIMGYIDIDEYCEKINKSRFKLMYFKTKYNDISRRSTELNNYLETKLNTEIEVYFSYEDESSSEDYQEERKKKELFKKYILAMNPKQETDTNPINNKKKRRKKGRHSQWKREQKIIVTKMINDLTLPQDIPVIYTKQQIDDLKMYIRQIRNKTIGMSSPNNNTD